MSERRRADGSDERGASAGSHQKTGDSAGNGTGLRTAIIRVDKGEVPLTKNDAIGATVSTKWLKIAAGGQWAAALVIGATLLYISDSIAQHATFAVLLALYGGFLAGRGSSNERVLDAIKDRDRAYLEVDRMAEVKKTLENALLEARISSKVEATNRKAIETTKAIEATRAIDLTKPKKKGKGDGK